MSSADFSIKKAQFSTFEINRLDINEITQYSLFSNLLLRGVESLMPPDAEGQLPEASLFYIDSTQGSSPLSTSELINIFISKEYNENLLKVTNREIAHLVSHIKFGRVPKNKNKLLFDQTIVIPFSTHYSKNSLESVTQDNYYSCGLSSLKVDVISNTGAYYAYKINMSLFFQNATVLINNELYKQLLTVPTKDPSSQPVAYTLLLGWATPNMANEVPENLKILYEQKLSLIINLVTYNLSFNPDGSVTLNIDFIGASESQTNALDADVLIHKFTFEEEVKDYQESINNANKELEQLKKSWTELQQSKQGEIDALQAQLEGITDVGKRREITQKIDSIKSEYTKDIPDATSGEKSATDSIINTIKPFAEMAGASDEQIYSAAQDAIIKSGNTSSLYYRQRKNILQNKISEAENQIDYARYVCIMKRLNHRVGLYNGKLSFAASATNSYIKFTPSFLDRPINSPETNNNALNYGAAKNVIERMRKLKQSDLGGVTDLTTAQKEFVDLYTTVFKSSTTTIAGNKSVDQVINEQGTAEYGAITFKYFFLGDLVSVLTENMYSNMAIDRNDDTPMDSKKIVLCTFDVIKNDAEKVTLDLAYFPISYNFFTSWYLKNIVSKNVKTYPFDRFVKELMNDCVLKVVQNIPDWQAKFKNFSSPLFTINKTYSDRTIEFTYSDMPKLINGGMFKIPASSITSNLGSAFVGDEDIKAQLYQYLFIYGQSSWISGNGDYEWNLSHGIHHFFVGATTGIMKDIKFVPINNTSRQSAQIINTMNEQDGKPSDEKFNVVQRYDVNISCIGFQYFKPGQIIYVDTSLLGFGKSTELNSVSRLFTLGGYYLVTNVSHDFEGNDFSTNIIAKFEGYGRS